MKNENEYYQPLFDMMSDKGLILLDSELDEIINTVVKMNADLSARNAEIFQGTKSELQNLSIIKECF